MLKAEVVRQLAGSIMRDRNNRAGKTVCSWPQANTIAFNRLLERAK